MTARPEAPRPGHADYADPREYAIAAGEYAIAHAPDPPEQPPFEEEFGKPDPRKDPGYVAEPEIARDPPDPKRHIGSKTAADLPWGKPPDQLADPFLTAEGVTVLYGKGGTGKGLIACYLVMRLVRSEHVVMLIDFENHRREWGSRLRGLGLMDEQLSRIHWRSPSDPEWTARKGSVGQVRDLIRDDALALGVTFLVVDSYTVATSTDDNSMGGQAAAQEFFEAMSRIGLPSLVIAHVRGDSGRFPDKPFGSIFVHNLARETWAVEAVPVEDIVERLEWQPAVVSLELRNKKANGRALAASQLVTFSFFPDGHIEVNDQPPTNRSIADLAADVLAGDGPTTIAGIAKAIKEDTGRDVDTGVLRHTLRRYGRRFGEDPSGRPRKWALKL